MDENDETKDMLETKVSVPDAQCHYVAVSKAELLCKDEQKGRTPFAMCYLRRGDIRKPRRSVGLANKAVFKRYQEFAQLLPS